MSTSAKSTLNHTLEYPSITQNSVSLSVCLSVPLFMDLPFPQALLGDWASYKYSDGMCRGRVDLHIHRGPPQCLSADVTRTT